MKAQAVAMDKLITEVYELYQDFPDFSLDLAVELQAQKSLEGLSKIRVFEGWKGGQPNQQGMARPLTLRDQPSSEMGLVQFKSTARRGAVVSVEERKSSKMASSVSAPNLNPVEYCLFLLRPKSE